MPQHPRYTNSPSRNLDKLYELLNQLVEFGIFHEEIYNSIDSIMADLYHLHLKNMQLTNEVKNSLAMKMKKIERMNQKSLIISLFNLV